MIDRISSLFGRLVFLLLLCSPLLIAGCSAPRYRMLLAEELSHQFIQEVYEVGVSEDGLLKYTKQMYQLGYIPKFSIEGKEEHLSHDELIEFITEKGRVKVSYNAFFSCELQSDRYTFRIGGQQ